MKKKYIIPTTQAYQIVQNQMLANSVTTFDGSMTGSGDGTSLSNRNNHTDIWGNEEKGGGIWK